MFRDAMEIIGTVIGYAVGIGVWFAGRVWLHGQKDIEDVKGFARGLMVAGLLAYLLWLFK